MEMNCKGLVSPQPILFVREVLKSLDPGDEVTVILDNAKAAEDLKAFAASEGFQPRDGYHKGEPAVIITRPEAADAVEKVTLGTSAEQVSSFIVTVSSSRFGQGNPRLGESLMQSFFYSMTRKEPLPDAVIFMNAGVNLVCQNSPVLQDLKVLEQEGVKILVDEASLNFYGFRDQLALGSKADLMEITGLLLQAQKTLAI